MQLRLQRIRVAENIPVDIPAAADRIDHRLVDALNQRFQVAFQNTVVLKCLTRCQPDSAITESVCDRVDRQPLLGRADATREARAQHEAVVGFEQMLTPLLPQITVVLLVETMEFADLRIGGIKRTGQLIRDTAAQTAPQVVTGRFDQLVLVYLCIHQ